MTDFAAAFDLTEANVRWFARVVVVGGTMGIAGAVYCALTFGIATGVVFSLVPGAGDRQTLACFPLLTYLFTTSGATLVLSSAGRRTRCRPRAC